MVRDIELEIAMSIIQLTGVTLPVLLGIAQYYFKNSEKINATLENHPDISDDNTPHIAAPVAIVTSGIILLNSYVVSALLIAHLENAYLTISLITYGVFLGIIFAIIVPLTLDVTMKGTLVAVILIVIICPAVLLLIWHIFYEYSATLAALGTVLILCLIYAPFVYLSRKWEDSGP